MPWTGPNLNSRVVTFPFVVDRTNFNLNAWSHFPCREWIGQNLNGRSQSLCRVKDQVSVGGRISLCRTSTGPTLAPPVKPTGQFAWTGQQQTSGDKRQIQIFIRGELFSPYYRNHTLNYCGYALPNNTNNNNNNNCTNVRRTLSL